MPTTLEQLETKFNLRFKTSFKWGTNFDEKDTGIYIISTSIDKSYLPKSLVGVSFNESEMDTWLKNAPNILLYGIKPSKQDLKKQLSRFWLADESILYIGKAEKQTLSARIKQFYKHKVGKNSPHKGGYWLKLLSNLNELYIHLYSTNDSHEVEKELLNFFRNSVSEASRKNLIDKEICIPFANLQLRSNVVKNHGLKNHCQ